MILQSNTCIILIFLFSVSVQSTTGIRYFRFRLLTAYDDIEYRFQRPISIRTSHRDWYQNHRNRLEKPELSDDPRLRKTFDRSIGSNAETSRIQSEKSRCRPKIVKKSKTRLKKSRKKSRWPQRARRNTSFENLTRQYRPESKQI